MRILFCLFLPLQLLALSELSIGAGYAMGNLHRQPEKYRVVPVYLRFGFYLNPYIGLACHRGTLQIALEPFYNQILKPKLEPEVGFDLFVAYRYPLTSLLSPYVEIGAGPMYLGLRTVAQGAPGFNFLDQIGAGLQLFITPCCTLNIGYRFRHISHARLRGKPNLGINSNGIFIASSLIY